MTGQIRIDPTALRTARPGFDRLADVVEATSRGLRSALTIEGNCWGHDDIGTAFADPYLPTAGQLEAALTELVVTLRRVGAAVATVADTVEASDRRGRARFGVGGAA